MLLNDYIILRDIVYSSVVSLAKIKLNSYNFCKIVNLIIFKLLKHFNAKYLKNECSKIKTNKSKEKLF